MRRLNQNGDLKLSNNVILLGAGFSFDAHIPLLGNFIQTIWEMVYRKKNLNGDALSFEDLEILDKALKIRLEMDGYHGRVSFNDRNIEDLLSMLYFTEAGKKGFRPKLNNFNNAIARTIEITCNVENQSIATDQRNLRDRNFNSIYGIFWESLLRRYVKTKDFPTIISLNYDLVLERSLAKLFINTRFNGRNRLPIKSVCMDYCIDYIPKCCYHLDYCTYENGWEREQGTNMFPNPDESAFPCELNVKYLKLHGSVNFPSKNSKNTFKPSLLCSTTQDPYIIPPVTNKSTSGQISSVWEAAMNELRDAKNIVIVGYSFPKTDVYLQSFLKASLGPNHDLNRITVFDPALNSDSETAKAMMRRFQDCFSAQFQENIRFNPIKETAHQQTGTTQSFINCLSSNPSGIFFEP